MVYLTILPILACLVLCRVEATNFEGNQRFHRQVNFGSNKYIFKSPELEGHNYHAPLSATLDLTLLPQSRGYVYPKLSKNFPPPIIVRQLQVNIPVTVVTPKQTHPPSTTRAPATSGYIYPKSSIPETQSNTYPRLTIQPPAESTVKPLPQIEYEYPKPKVEFLYPSQALVYVSNLVSTKKDPSQPPSTTKPPIIYLPPVLMKEVNTTTPKPVTTTSATRMPTTTTTRKPTTTVRQRPPPSVRPPPPQQLGYKYPKQEVQLTYPSQPPVFVSTLPSTTRKASPSSTSRPLATYLPPVPIKKVPTTKGKSVINTTKVRITTTAGTTRTSTTTVRQRPPPSIQSSTPQVGYEYPKPKIQLSYSSEPRLFIPKLLNATRIPNPPSTYLTYLPPVIIKEVPTTTWRPVTTTPRRPSSIVEQMPQINIKSPEPQSGYEYPKPKIQISYPIQPTVFIPKISSTPRSPNLPSATRPRVTYLSPVIIKQIRTTTDKPVITTTTTTSTRRPTTTIITTYRPTTTVQKMSPPTARVPSPQMGYEYPKPKIQLPYPSQLSVFIPKVSTITRSPSACSITRLPATYLPPVIIRKVHTTIGKPFTTTTRRPTSIVRQTPPPNTRPSSTEGGYEYPKANIQLSYPSQGPVFIPALLSTTKSLSPPLTTRPPATYLPPMIIKDVPSTTRKKLAAATTPRPTTTIYTTRKLTTTLRQIPPPTTRPPPHQVDYEYPKIKFELSYPTQPVMLISKLPSTTTNPSPPSTLRSTATYFFPVIIKEVRTKTTTTNTRRPTTTTPTTRRETPPPSQTISPLATYLPPVIIKDISTKRRIPFITDTMPRKKATTYKTRRPTTTLRQMPPTNARSPPHQVGYEYPIPKIQLSYPYQSPVFVPKLLNTTRNLSTPSMTRPPATYLPPIIIKEVSTTTYKPVTTTTSRKTPTTAKPTAKQTRLSTIRPPPPEVEYKYLKQKNQLPKPSQLLVFIPSSTTRSPSPPSTTRPPATYLPPMTIKYVSATTRKIVTTTTTPTASKTRRATTRVSQSQTLPPTVRPPPHQGYEYAKPKTQLSYPIQTPDFEKCISKHANTTRNSSPHSTIRPAATYLPPVIIKEFRTKTGKPVTSTTITTRKPTTTTTRRTTTTVRQTPTPSSTRPPATYLPPVVFKEVHSTTRRLNIATTTRRPLTYTIRHRTTTRVPYTKPPAMYLPPQTKKQELFTKTASLQASKVYETPLPTHFTPASTTEKLYPSTKPSTTTSHPIVKKYTKLPATYLPPVPKAITATPTFQTTTTRPTTTIIKLTTTRSPVTYLPPVKMTTQDSTNVRLTNTTARPATIRRSTIIITKPPITRFYTPPPTYLPPVVTKKWLSPTKQPTTRATKPPVAYLLPVTTTKIPPPPPRVYTKSKTEYLAPVPQPTTTETVNSTPGRTYLPPSNNPYSIGQNLILLN